MLQLAGSACICTSVHPASSHVHGFFGHVFALCRSVACGVWVRVLQALLVIDVQNDFISGTLAVEGSEAIVPIINTMRDSFDCAP